MKLSLYGLCLTLFGVSVLAQDTDPPTTLSPEPVTNATTVKPTTITTKPTTTTVKPTTKTPSPPITVDYYSVKEGDTTCIMLRGKFEFTVTYKTGGNTTNKTTITVPKPTDPINPKVDGSCKTEDGLQYIEITWGNALPNFSFKMFFNSSDNKNWHILNTTSVINLEDKLFPNATQSGKALMSNINYTLSPYDIAVNHSYQCKNEITAQNITTTMEGVQYELPIVFSMSTVHLQAYNQIKKTTDFVQGTLCEMDKVGDVVPIAVGCALAALVLFVGIAYCVGRRRRTSVYQSV